MIPLIIIVVFIFTVIAVAPLLISEPGYIAISMNNTIIELTVYSAIFWLLAFTFMVFLVFKLTRSSLKLGFKGWNKVAFINRRKAVRNFNKGIATYILEDYQQAEALLAKSAEPAQAQQTAYLLAASAAAKQNNSSSTQHYLTLLNNYNKDIAAKSIDLEVIIVQIKLALTYKNYEDARTLLDQYHKQIGHDERLLSLEITLCLIEQRFQTVIEYLPLAKKQKKLSKESVQTWENKAFLGMFSELIRLNDQKTLQSYWQDLARKTKQQEAVIFAYCRVLADNNIIEPLEALLLPVLKKDINPSFLKQLKHLPLGKTSNKAQTLITVAQKHLHKDPYNAKWLSCLAHLALINGQWLLAEKSFHSLFNNNLCNTSENKPQYDDVDVRGYASALTEQQKYQEANVLLQQVIEQKQTR